MSKLSSIACAVCLVVLLAPFAADARPYKITRSTIAYLTRFGGYGCILDQRNGNRLVVRIAKRRIRRGETLPVINSTRERRRLVTALSRNMTTVAARRTMKALSDIDSAVAFCAPASDTSTPAPAPQPTPAPTEAPNPPPTPRPDEPPPANPDGGPQGPAPVPTVPAEDVPAADPTPVSIPETLLIIRAQNAGGERGQLTVMLDESAYNRETFTLNQRRSAPQQILSSEGTVLGTVSNIQIRMGLAPLRQVYVQFTLDAGASDLQVQTVGGSMGVLRALDPQARALAAYYVEDRNSNGVIVSEIGNGMYHPYTSDRGERREFAALMGRFEASAGGRGSASSSDPISGYRPVGAPLDSLGGSSAFSITQGDRVTATNQMTLAP